MQLASKIVGFSVVIVSSLFGKFLSAPAPERLTHASSSWNVPRVSYEVLSFMGQNTSNGAPHKLVEPELCTASLNVNF